MIATDLTNDSVSILDNTGGRNHWRAYVNSEQCRTMLENECPSDIVAKVLEAWGDTPTVLDPELPVTPDPEPCKLDELSQQVDELKAVIERIM